MISKFKYCKTEKVPLSNPGAYSEPCQTYNIECLTEIING